MVKKGFLKSSECKTNIYCTKQIINVTPKLILSLIRMKRGKKKEGKNGALTVLFSLTTVLILLRGRGIHLYKQNKIHLNSFLTVQTWKDTSIKIKSKVWPTCQNKSLQICSLTPFIRSIFLFFPLLLHAKAH